MATKKDIYSYMDEYELTRPLTDSMQLVIFMINLAYYIPKWLQSWDHLDFKKDMTAC